MHIKNNESEMRATCMNCMWICECKIMCYNCKTTKINFILTQYIYSRLIYERIKNKLIIIIITRLIINQVLLQKIE